MASKYSASSVDALLDCPLCKVRYGDTKTPKILNCGHTVCVECLRTIVTHHELQCPKCLKVTPAPKGNVELLVSSLVVLELLDIRQAQCKQCTIQTKTTRCFHCMEEMCTVCLEEHRIKSESNFQGLHKKLKKSAQDLKSYMLHIDTALANAETDAKDQKKTLDAVFGKVLSEMAKRKASLLSILDNNLHTIRASHMIIKSLLESKLKNTTSLAQTINLNLVNGIHTFKHEHLLTTIECGASRIKEAETTLSLCSLNITKLHLDINVKDIVSHIQRWGQLDEDEVVLLKPNGIVEQPKQKADQETEQGVIDNTSISITIADNELVSKSPGTCEIPVHQMSLSAGLSFGPPISVSPFSMSTATKNGTSTHPTSVLGSHFSKTSSQFMTPTTSDTNEKTDMFQSTAFKSSEGNENNITVDTSNSASKALGAISGDTVPRMPDTMNTSSAATSVLGSHALSKCSPSGFGTSSSSSTPVADILMSNASKTGDERETPVAVTTKPTFGGAAVGRFTFTQAPNVERPIRGPTKRPVVKTGEEKATTQHVNPCASFSFGSPKAALNTPNTGETTPSATAAFEENETLVAATTKPTFCEAAFGGFTFTQIPVLSKFEEKQMEKTITAPVVEKEVEKTTTQMVNLCASFMASKAGEVKETPVAAFIASSIPVATTTKPTSSSIPVSATTKPTLNSIPVATTKPTFGGAAFGGFTFTQTHVVSKTEEKQIEKTISAPVAVKVEEKAITKPVNPFASFSFGSSKNLPNSSNTEATTPPSLTKDESVAMMPNHSVFGSDPSGNPTFESTASSWKTEGFAEPSGVSLSGVSTLVRGPSSQKSEPKISDPEKGGVSETTGAEENYEPHVDFQPIVSLPEIQLITGEEDEVTLFSERAKLYRDDTETKQWKQSCVGMMKIMENTKMEKFRILMRREQILKLCANHNIAVDMKLKPMASSERAWCWLAQDYAEEEMRNEQFAVKFKTNDEAASFKQVFERCQERLLQYEKGEMKSTSNTETSRISSAQKIISCNEATVTEPNSLESTGTVATEKFEAKQSLSELFQVKNGQWECDTCYVKNKANSKTCVSCETPKPCNEEVQSEEVTITETPQDITVTAKTDFKSGFMFGGFGGNGGLETGLGSAAVSSTTTASKGASSSKAAGIGAAVSATGGFKLDGSLLHTVNASTSATHAQTESTTTTMHQKTSVDLSTPVQKETVSTNAGTRVKFRSIVGEPAKPGEFTFNFTFFEKEVEKKVGPKTCQSRHDVDDIYFTPIVKLPDNVELKTGEEDEEILFVYRAKLYRFAEEWRERGLGNVKILKNRTTARCRLLMRRERVHKICMNHYIQADVELKPMAKLEGKVWIWHADNFSEGELQHEQFALRFKTEEIAAYFQTVYDCVRKDEPVPSPPEKEPKSTPLKLDSLQPFSFTPDSSSVGFSTKSETPLRSVSSSKPEVSAATNMPASPAVFGFSFKPTSSDTQSKGAMTEGFSFKTPTGGFKTSVFSGSPNMPVSSSTDITDEAVFSSNKSSILVSLISQPASIANNSDAIVPAPKTDLDDVIYVSTERPSAEQLAMANKYQLPPGFYLYEKRPVCKGCLGCHADDFDFSLIGTDANVDIPRKPGSPHTLPPKATVKAEPDTTPCFGKASQGVGDFASLAAKNTEQSCQFGQKSDTKPFQWPGVDNTLFRNKDEDGVEQGPDIHFEPIVQLPEAVDLKTGEEDEEVVFCQRVRLYRFDNGQWKERGVGELKVLRDQTSGRVRLLMRREQVYKVACNHALTVDMRLTRMATSETAWCWVAYDFADSEPCTQQLAAKFKTIDLALQFKDAIESCQQVMRECLPKAAELKPAPSQIPTETTEDPEVDSSFVTVTQDAETGEGDEKGYGEEDEEYEDEYSTEEKTEETLLFVKRATLFYLDAEGKPINVGMGELMVIYDDDVMAARIRMRSDDGDQVCNHIICRRYNLNIHNKDRYAEWAAQDFSTDDPEKRMFRAHFSSAVALEEFDHVFQDGLELANQSEIDEVNV